MVKTSVVVLSALAAIVGIIMLAIILLRLIAAIQRKRSYRTLQLEIANLGNIESRYTLQARDAASAP